MPELIAKLEQFGELRLTPLSKEKLLRISAASVDRLLQAERRKQQLRRRSHTKAGTLLKHQIPIRTFAEWDEAQPGFVEIDLVAHDGGLALGDRDLSLRSRIHEPFVSKQFRKRLTKMRVHTLHIVLEVPKL